MNRISNPQEAQKRIAELSDKLNYYNQQYYQNSISVVSDYDFDMLLQELVELENTFPAFKSEHSPTQRVGGGIIKEFPTVKHQYLMLSLGNTYSEQEVVEFDERVKKNLGIEKDIEYICEMKFDGVSISLIYENGKFIQAITRGDGVQGDDITANVKTIKTLPLSLKGTFPERFEVRGEIFLSHKQFEKLNAERLENGEPLYANPRNTASGSVKQQDSAEVARRGLDCYLYTLMGDDLPFKTHLESIQALEKLGFNISQTYQKCQNIQEVLAYIKHWETKRHELPLDTDGVVVKVNEYALQQELGLTSKSPRWAMAYKYKAETASTILQSVTFQVGRTGAVTPVAELKPVQLAGTTVKRASLHNANEIERLDLRVGDTVFVEKSGEIIPKVTGVDVAKRLETSLKLNYPTHCPECGTQLVRSEGEAIFYCSNEKACPPQLKGKVEHFVQRKAMDISSLGEKIIEQLYHANLLRNIADLYLLQEKEMLKLERFGEKSAQKILKNIEESKKVSFDRVLYGLGIRFVGGSVSKKLADHFGNIDALRSASIESLVQIPEIGERIAQSVILWFQDIDNQKLVERLQAAGLQFVSEKVAVTLKSEKFLNKTFVVSGVFSNFSREGIQTEIEVNGGKISSSISSKLDYLVAGENMGPAKLEKAQKLNIKIISEADFMEMLGS